MGNLEVIARIRIRPGELEGFKAQAAELLRLTREQDTKTLRYDWYIDKNAMRIRAGHRDGACIRGRSAKSAQAIRRSCRRAPTVSV